MNGEDNDDVCEYELTPYQRAYLNRAAESLAALSKVKDDDLKESNKYSKRCIILDRVMMYRHGRQYTNIDELIRDAEKLEAFFEGKRKAKTVLKLV